MSDSPDKAKLFLRKNGTFGASCGKCRDTGHEIFEDIGLFTVWSVDDPDQAICTAATREEAETAISEDWARV